MCVYVRACVCVRVRAYVCMDACSILVHPSATDNKPPFKVAIIGAGVSGIGAARYCSKFAGCISFTIYEQGTYIGGTWIYTPCTELDEMGQPVHTSMYEDLM